MTLNIVRDAGYITSLSVGIQIGSFLWGLPEQSPPT
jgi:hypothetical protein